MVNENPTEVVSKKNNLKLIEVVRENDQICVCCGEAQACDCTPNKDKCHYCAYTDCDCSVKRRA